MGGDGLLVEPPHDPAEPGQRRAGHEDDQEQAADAVAERLDHLAVFHPGPDQQADLGVLQDVAHGQKQAEADADRHQRYFSMAASPIRIEP